MPEKTCLSTGIPTRTVEEATLPKEKLEPTIEGLPFKCGKGITPGYHGSESFPDIVEDFQYLPFQVEVHMDCGGQTWGANSLDHKTSIHRLEEDYLIVPKSVASRSLVSKNTGSLL